MAPLRVFIGYDKREAVTYHTCVQSIIEHARYPQWLQFTPVTGEQRDGSNAFIYARFLVPYWCGFKGRAVFIDGDMLLRADISELFAGRMPEAVRVVKHNYKTKHAVKYLGYANADYPRKNWSSVILWNCARHRVLTPAFVAAMSGAYLHRFSWLEDDQIGELPPEWNKLVLEQPLSPDDKLRHFTIGAPCFSEYADCDGAQEWHQTLHRAMAPHGA